MTAPAQNHTAQREFLLINNTLAVLPRLQFFSQEITAPHKARRDNIIMQVSLTDQ